SPRRPLRRPTTCRPRSPPISSSAICAPARCRSWRASTASSITPAGSRLSCAPRCSAAALRSRATTASPGSTTGCDSRVPGATQHVVPHLRYITPLTFRAAPRAGHDSLRLDPGVLDHLGPFAELDLDEVAELLRRGREGLEADRGQPPLHLGVVD